MGTLNLQGTELITNYQTNVVITNQSLIIMNAQSIGESAKAI